MKALALCLALSACGPLWAYGELHPFQGGEIKVKCSLPFHLRGCSVFPAFVG